MYMYVYVYVYECVYVCVCLHFLSGAMKFIMQIAALLDTLRNYFFNSAYVGLCVCFCEKIMNFL